MMSKLSTTIGLAALLMTNQVFAQSQVDIKKQAGDLKVQFCDLALAPKTFVGFQVGENGLIQKEILGENHCVTKTYGSGLMVEGKKIVIHKMSKSDDESQGKLYEGILKETSSSSSDTSAGTSTSTFNDVKYEVTTLENRDGDVYKIQIKVCHPKFKVADAVSVTNRATLSANKEVSKYTNVGRDKCFTTEYTKGEIQDGDIIGIGLYSVEKPFEVTLIGVPWKRSAAATPGSSNGGNSNAGNSGNSSGNSSGGTSGNNGSGTSTSTSTSNLKVESREVISSRAKKAARSFVSNVTKTLGQIENIRYNIFLGFRDEERRAKSYGQDVNDANSVAQMASYREGYVPTVGDQSSGYSAGQQWAADQGQRLAQADVGAAIDAVLNGQASQVNVNHRQDFGQASFSGLEPDITKPASVADRLAKKDQEIQQEWSRRFYINDQDLVLADNLWNDSVQVTKLYGANEFKFDLLNSYFRENNAFDAWARGYFQPRQSDVSYYSQISDANQYQNASDNQQLFRSEFEREYNILIVPEWNRVVTVERPDIQRASEDLYVQLTNDYAHDLGSYNGRREAYIAGSKRGYSDKIKPDYEYYVDQTLQAAKSSAVITDTSVRAQAADGSSEITVGQVIDLVLTSASNRGMLAGQIQVVPQASNEVQVLSNGYSQNIGALSKLNSAVLLRRAMFLARVSAPDENIVVSFKINGSSAQAYLHSSFENLVLGLTRATSDQTQKAILTYIVQFLKAEWNDKKSTGSNGFDKRQGTLLIERMIAKAMTMTAQEKSVLQRFSKEIKSAYGDNGVRPGGRFGLSFYKDDFDSAMAILAQAGIK